MKFPVLSYFGVLFLTFFTCIVAIPHASPSTTGSQLAGPTEILNLASDLLAVQTVGAQTTPAGIEDLCDKFDLSRLQASGYNITTIKNVFCQAASSTGTLPSLAEVQRLTVEYSSWIWIFQAVGALGNDQVLLQQLCKSINVASSFSVGQNGTLVKNTICDVANGNPLPDVPVPRFESEGSKDGGFTDGQEIPPKDTTPTSTPTPAHKGPKYHSRPHYPFNTAF
ncbi:MAG: hypothetical protein Q9209_000523 [Squamulea sp. 1 TL-2023]